MFKDICRDEYRGLFMRDFRFIVNVGLVYGECRIAGRMRIVKLIENNSVRVFCCGFKANLIGCYCLEYRGCMVEGSFKEVLKGE